jgi:SAM-dependent methyltransferase
MPHAVYARSASTYDLIYSFKDYASEAVKIREILERECSTARELLDVACGTAEHARFLVECPACGSSDAQPVVTFRVDGVDLEPSFLEIARVKVPSGRFVVGDMADFDLGRRYDAVLCLFSAIGYVLDLPRLVSTLRCFARHLRPGGVALVEPWFAPDAWRVGSVHMQTAEHDDLKVCRMVVAAREGRVSVLPFHYLVATPTGVESFLEEHRMALRTQEEMLAAFHEAGLDARFDPVGLDGRGMYVARVAMATGAH